MRQTSVQRYYPIFLTLAVGAIMQGCQSSKWERGRMSHLPVNNSSTPTQRAPAKRKVPAAPTRKTVLQPNRPLPANDTTPTSKNEWVPLHYWASSQNLGSLRRVSKEQFHLVTRWGVFGLAAKSRHANFNGSRFYLGYPLLLTNGLPYVHMLDAEKNFRPMIGWTERVPRKRGVICIDPGHGGDNRGTKSILGNHFEKQYSLDWAVRLKPELEKRGWTVVMTRKHDKTVSLTDRVKFADKYAADVFISLHFNASGKGAAGLETYCTTPRGMPSTLTRNYADPRRVILPNNQHDYRNMQLAARVHHSLLRNVGMADRGIRRARFMSVLVKQKRPAILIEGGFLSDPKEAKLVASAAYRQRLAEAVAAALN